MALGGGTWQFQFQSTHLLRGATFERQTGPVPVTNFNPRTSYEVRLVLGRKAARFGFISIHAPLTRCDEKPIRNGDHPTIFQSTHLLRGATSDIATIRIAFCYFNPRTSYEVRPFGIGSGRIYADISIHAPLTRCDSGRIIWTGSLRNFNPRTSYEVRQLSRR